jgi:putative transposase
MQPNYKPNFKNRPPHIHTEPGYYFITVRTVEGQWFLKPDNYKQILLDTIKAKIAKFDLSLVAYAILNNHYHLIINIPDTKLFSKFMAELNGASAKAINEADHVIDRKIWWNYFEKLLIAEADFYKHLNYIHQNPIKHNVSKKLEYKFSSYNAWLNKKGKEYLDDSFRKYPIIDFKTFNDEF